MGYELLIRPAAGVDATSRDASTLDVITVLLTRGMVGTLLYSVDAEAQDALRRLVGSGVKELSVV